MASSNDSYWKAVRFRSKPYAEDMTVEKRDLESAFGAYLQSGLDTPTSWAMVNALAQTGLKDEARALQSYLQGKSEGFHLTDEVWRDRRCFIGSLRPRSANPGDIWFDVVELTPMVLVPNRPGTSEYGKGWIAIHPVYTWQFRTFLRRVELGPEREIFGVPDLYKIERFDGADELAFVTNLYHDEAYGYAGWFQKVATGQLDLQAARHFLADTPFARILPAGLRLWDHADYIEYVRGAIGSHTLDKKPKDEMSLHLTRANRGLSDRMLYFEDERYEDIGVSTWVEYQYQEDLQYCPYSTIFFNVLNVAPRPPDR